MDHELSHLFTAEDLETSEKEIKCYQYLHKQAMDLFAKAEFGMAAVHLDNMARSARELQRMRNSKQAIDEAVSLLREAEKRAELMRGR